ncbi:MAG: aromatic ring-hydroxylating dioxygenase subunit alpha [Parvularculaceae bacterium]|nr:aromatic ring-hydroxylating dioxygenase subunit alpha [Parvularculaceae bacterium]
MTAETETLPTASAEDIERLGTGPVPARPYYDPAWFEQERQAIFLRDWIVVGHVSEVPEPGSFIRRDLEFAGASLLIARGRDGVVRAFHNVCTHRGTQLVEEREGRRASFSCPYHRWTFSADGDLQSAPDFESFHVSKADCALKQVALDICAGLIFVCFAKPPRQTLRAFLGPLVAPLETLPIARATTFSEYVYEIDANWKLNYDNFQENYHLRYIHPRSGKATIGAENPFGYPARYGLHGVHRTQTIWTNPKPEIEPAQGFAFGRAAAAAAKTDLLANPFGREYFALFPNFFLLGTPLQHFSHTVYPIAADRSRGVIRLYWVGEDDTASTRFSREYAMASVRDIHAEDRAVIAAGQRGLSSGALDQIHFQKNEALCRHLFVSVEAAVEAYRKERGDAA